MDASMTFAFAQPSCATSLFCNRLLRAVGHLAIGSMILLQCSSLHADTLRDIYELAVKNDAKLQAATATYHANLETEKQARAKLLPQVNAEGSYSGNHRLQDSQTARFNGSDFVNEDIHQQTTLRSSSWNVNLMQPIFDLPSWFSFKSGKALSEQATAQIAYEQQDLIVRVADAYFEVLRQWDNVQASRAEEIATKEQLEQAQQRMASGIAAITDVHEARAAYKASIARRITDEGNMATAYEALTILTAQSHANLWLLKSEFPVVDPQPANRADWVQFAMANNYSLKAALAAMNAANENATAKTMEHMPKVSGSLNYQEDNAGGDQTINPVSPFISPPGSESHSKAAMIRVSVPIFSSGYTSSQARQANEQYNAALQQRIETERTVIQTTRAKHIAASTDVQRVQAQAESIESAQSALDATRAGYRVGTRSIVDVLVSQRALFSARRDHATARYDYVVDMLHLKQLAGTLSPKDIYELDGWMVEPRAPLMSNYSKN